MSDYKFWYKIIIILSLLFFAQIIGPFTKGLIAGHDVAIHVIYMRKFYDAFVAGQFPIRWIDWIFPGYNQPLFNFYQPGFYYLFLIPRALGLSNFASHNLVLFSLWAGSGALMFAFARKHFGTLPGLLSAFFYVFAPYHLLDIFIRMAHSEIAAISIVPGIFWTMKAYWDTQKGYYLTLLSLFFALVIISHSPTIIMFAPLILAYLAYLYFDSKSTKKLTSISLALLTGAGITAFSTLPGLLEQKFVQTTFLRSGYYDYHFHFVCPYQLFVPFWGFGADTSTCDDGISLQLGLVHWLVVALTLLFFLLRTKIKNYSIFKNPRAPLLVTFLVITFISLYMTLEASLPIWQTLPLVPYIQYPWRFLSVATFTASFLAAALLAMFKKELHLYAAYTVSVLLVVFAYANYMQPVAYFKKEIIDVDATDLQKEMLNFAERISFFEGFNPEIGYMPKWTQILPPDDGPKSEIQVATTSARVENYQLAAHHKEYTVNVTEPTIARFYTHFFPGWRVLFDNQEVQPNFDNIYGYMDLPLPAGNHQIKLVLENTPIRSFSNMLTINFAIVALSFIFLFGRKEPRTMNHKQ